MKKRLLVPLIPAVACCAFAAPALAATQEAASENWAGYVVTPNSASGFSAVSGAWTEPRVSCGTSNASTYSAGANDESTYSAYWVGLGGGGEQSQALEQIGTQADCGSDGKATYYAWYELVPSAPVKLALTVHAGDTLWARTAVSGNKVSLYIKDRTSGQVWNRTLTMTAATPDTSTAEWVAEAPSECAGGTSGDCAPLPLADFGTATFSNAHTTAGRHTGTINDSHWTPEAIALVPSSSSLFGGGYGGYYGGGYGGAYSDYSAYSDASEGAAPTKLKSGGTKFSVKYGATVSTQSSGSGQPEGEGYPSASSGYSGYGYPGGGYNYGGYGYGGSGGYYGGYYGGWGY